MFKLYIDKAFKKLSKFFGKYIFVYTKIFKYYEISNNVIKGLIWNHGFKVLWNIIVAKKTFTCSQESAIFFIYSYFSSKGCKIVLSPFLDKSLERWLSSKENGIILRNFTFTFVSK